MGPISENRRSSHPLIDRGGERITLIHEIVLRPREEYRWRDMTWFVVCIVFVGNSLFTAQSLREDETRFCRLAIVGEGVEHSDLGGGIHRTRFIPIRQLQYGRFFRHGKFKRINCPQLSLKQIGSYVNLRSLMSGWCLYRLNLKIEEDFCLLCRDAVVSWRDISENRHSIVDH